MLSHSKSAMLTHHESADHALKSLKGIGMDSAQVGASRTRKDELNFAVGELNLLRTTTETGLGLSAIRGARKAALAVNRATAEAIDHAAGELAGLVEAGVPDPAYAYAPSQPSRSFNHGPPEADFPKMRERMDEFLDNVRSQYPKVILEEGYLEFTRSVSTLLNSNGVKFDAQQGRYCFFMVFSAKDGSLTSGFNYTRGTMKDLSRPLLNVVEADALLQQASGSLVRKPVAEKFTGQLLLTPHCLMELLGAWLGYLGEGALLNGTSVFKDKLGQQIASPLLCVRCDPRGESFASQEFFDGDGFASEAMDILDKGVLKTYLLSLYGANKLGLPRAKNSAQCLSVDAGSVPKDEMLRSVKRGLVMCRFSGGRPAPNGDFSGVAKNSFYVENGEILYPVAETMVSGNIVELFRNLVSVSRERVEFGVRTLPWVMSEGFTISGK